MKRKGILGKLYLVLVGLFLYAPIITLVVLSFNESKSRAHWGGFTLKWYAEVFSSSTIMQALYNSLSIALLASVISTVIGVLACVGISAMSRKGRTICLAGNNIPMFNAEIVTGISLMLFFGVFGVSLGYGTILVSHVAFCIPYVILSIMPRMKTANAGVYEAAQDLGAGPARAFFKVVLPELMPGIVAGFLLAFTMSLDDFVISYFTRGRGVDTLSTLIYTQVRRGIVPSMYALSTIIFVAVLVVLLVQNFMPERLERWHTERERRREERAAGAAAAANERTGAPAASGEDGLDEEDDMDPRVTRRLFLGGVLTGAVTGSLAALGVNALMGRERTPAPATDAALEADDEAAPEEASDPAAPAKDEVLYVYNWGEYIDEDVVGMFEEETGIRVVYDTFETLEMMYPIIEQGQTVYDVVCPSDYMIQKMIANDLLAPIDFDNVPNIANIGESYLEACRGFDPTGEYAVPYTWGTMGILYNTEKVDDPVESWSILWDEKYAGDILMQNSVRDAMCVPLKLLGYSCNSTDPDELYEARDLLIEQKPLVQAYVVDQVRDKMIGGEAALGVIYSGEYLFCKEENPSLAYAVPEEGSNIWFDAWVIPKNAENKANAEKWIDFLCRPDIALRNFEYITYATANTAAMEMIDDEILEDPGVFAPQETIDRCEVFTWLGEEAESLYGECWTQIKGA